MRDIKSNLKSMKICHMKSSNILHIFHSGYSLWKSDFLKYLMASSVLKDIFIFVYFYKYLLITHQVSVGELDTRDMKIGKQTFSE